MKKVLFISLIIAALLGCAKPELLYVTNANIVDVETGRIIENQFVEITDGIITKISPMTEIPGGIEDYFDAKSMYLSPGLSDMNVMLGTPMTDLEFWGDHPGDRMLAAGVTTIRNGGNTRKNPSILVDEEEKFRGNKTKGPDIIKVAIANYTTGKDPEVLESEIKYADADYVKLLAPIPPEQMDNILNYTNVHDIYTCVTVYSLSDLRRCCGLRLDEIPEFSVLDYLLIDEDFVKTIDWFDDAGFLKSLDEYFSRYYDLDDRQLVKQIEPAILEVAGILKDNNIIVTTSLASEEISVMKLDDPDGYEEYALRYRMPEYRDRIFIMKRAVFGDHFRLEAVPDWVRFQYRLDRIFLRYLKEAGITVTAATEWTANSWYGLAPGIALHDELRILTECGYSNLEALQTATLNASKVFERMGTEHKRGLVKAGYDADFIFTADNPLDDIGVLRQPQAVMKTGVLYGEEQLKPLR